MYDGGMQSIDRLIQGEVDVSTLALNAYSRDASIFSVTPQAVFYPKDTNDLRSLVFQATQRRQSGDNVSLTARNGGTCMSGGSLTESWVLDMSRYFNQISAFYLAERTIWVQGGVMHIEIEKALQNSGLLFAPYTSSRDICGIGGMIGNNASGEKSVRYGPTSSNVETVRVMLSNGELCDFSAVTAKELEEKKQAYTLEGHLYREISKLIHEHQDTLVRHHPRVKKNAAGYPLWELWNSERTLFNLGRLFIGSQGTLGIVTDAKLHLIPIANGNRMIVVPIKNLRDLASTVQTMLRFGPDTCETFDSHTYKLARQYYPDDAARCQAAEGQQMVVFAIYAGSSQKYADDLALAAQDALQRLGQHVNWVAEPEIVESYLLIRRKSFKLLLDHPLPQTKALAFLEDSIVPIEHYGEFLASLEVILADYRMTYTYAGHIGDGSIRLIPLANMDEPHAPELIMELAERVYDLVFAFGGSMSVDHNDGLIRTPFLEHMYGHEMVELFEKVKTLFDPLGIFNPRKKVGGSLEYSREHIVRGN